MNKKEEQILSEILLELTLAIGRESSYTALMKNTLSLWLKRLNCVVGITFRQEGEEVNVEYVLPQYFTSSDTFKQLQPLLKSYNSSKNLYDEFKLNDLYHYYYKLDHNLKFVFARKTKMSNGQCMELLPIAQFFSRALENAKEKEKRIFTQKQLDAERNLLRTLVDHIPDAVYLKNNNREKILANKADLVNMGVELESEILGMTDEEIYGEENAIDSIKTENELLQTLNPIVNKEDYFVRKNGEKAWFLTSKFPYKDVDGKSLGIVGISKDISEIKSKNEQIKLLSLVASQSTNGVIITDIEGRIEWINEGFTRLTGFTIEELKGKKPGHVLQGEDTDPEANKLMSESLEKKIPFEVEIVNYAKNGTPYWIHIQCNPLRDENGNVTGFMAIEQDITEKKIYQEELISAKQIAEKAQNAEKQFLASMSHEIRTPLNAIIGMTSLLLDTAVDAEQKDYLDTLNHSSKFLLRLISDILDLAKVEAGKIELNNKAFDLTSCLKGIQKIFKTKIKNKGKNLDIDISFSEALPRHLIGDEVLLEQVLMNLVGNAEKFTERGRILIKVEQLSQIENELTLKFTIEDTGIGMSNEDVMTIFNKFKQIEQDQLKNIKGTGLGLTITKEIIEILGGNIEVESVRGVGTKFYFAIPFLSTTQKIEAIELHPYTTMDENLKHSEKKLPILVVEDNLINQKYLTRLLEKQEIAYDIANNGEEAVNRSLQTKYGLILMDIQMPILNGYEATSVIKNAQNPNSSTPIVALTASAMLDQKNKAMETGMDGYLTKPFTPQQLQVVINQYYYLDS